MLPAVVGQIAYAKSVRGIIRSIMRRLLDGDWIDRIVSSGDGEFKKKLDEAFFGVNEVSANEQDYRRAVVKVLCNEISDFCMVLKEVCKSSGYSEYYHAHISHERFVRLVLSVDTAKLDKMIKIVGNESLTPIDLLRAIGAVLNDESLETRSALNASERRRANAELRTIAEDVKKTLQVGVTDIRNDIAAIDGKVERIAERRSRRGKYDERTVEFCVACVDLGMGNETLRCAGKTKIRLEDIFIYNKRKLAERGVNDAKQFAKIVHAYRARESRKRDKEL